MNARRSVMTMMMSLAAPAWSQGIYRCGDVYSDQPCEGGRPLRARDERTQAQQAQAEQNTRRDEQLADVMEQERLRREALAQRTPLILSGSRPASTPARAGPGAPRRPEVFMAREPGKAGKQPRRKPRTRSQ